MPKTKGEQTTVRITAGLKDAVNEYLQTEEAKQLGLDSQSDVVAQALREFLNDQGYYRRRFGSASGAEKDTR